MANQRADGKRLIGAQATAELWAGVDIWLSQNPGKTVTDFVLAALVDKLEQEEIPISRADAFRDNRARLPQTQSQSQVPPKGVSYFKTPRKKKHD